MMELCRRTPTKLSYSLVEHKTKELVVILQMAVELVSLCHI